MNKKTTMLEFLELEGYYNIHSLDDGIIIGLYDFIFTTGICYELNLQGYSGRYCYNNKTMAIQQMHAWLRTGTPPTDYAAHK